MKKALILAYDFPPYISVGGLRPHYWYEHFEENGIYPVVVTRNWNPLHGNELDYIQPSNTNEVVIEKTAKGTLIKTPYKATLSNRLNLKGKNDKFSNLLKKMSTGWNEIGQWYFPTGTKYELYKAAKNYLKENKIDVILATGEPFVLFQYASKLSKEFDIPWIADYRDPWSNNALRSKSRLSFWFNSLNERKSLKSVTHIITVSDFFKKKIEQILGKKSVSIIPNGYNEDAFRKVENIVQNSQKLTISLAGTLYDWHPYQLFLDVIDTYLQKHSSRRLKIEFFGINKVDELKQIIEKSTSLKNTVFIYPRMTNQQLLSKMAESNVLLLFNYYSYMGTKIYDYLALNRKILLCFEEDKEAYKLKEKYYNVSAIEGLSERLQADLIKETTSGIVVKDTIHLEQVLEELFSEFNNTQEIKSHTINAEKYSRKIHTEKLVLLIKNTR